jgi:hypothetical protein
LLTRHFQPREGGEGLVLAQYVPDARSNLFGRLFSCLSR